MNIVTACKPSLFKVVTITLYEFSFILIHRRTPSQVKLLLSAIHVTHVCVCIRRLFRFPSQPAVFLLQPKDARLQFKRGAKLAVRGAVQRAHRRKTDRRVRAPPRGVISYINMLNCYVLLSISGYFVPVLRHWTQ